MLVDRFWRPSSTSNGSFRIHDISSTMEVPLCFHWRPHLHNDRSSSEDIRTSHTKRPLSPLLLIFPEYRALSRVLPASRCRGFSPPFEVCFK